MATYNGARFLEEQLESFARQTRLPDELVVSDDGSADGTPEILKDFAARAPFDVKIIRNAINLGYAGNFGRALEGCTGDLIFLCDQDDKWFPDKLAHFEAWADAQPEVEILACDAELTDGALIPSGRTKRGQIAALGLPEDAFVMGCCLAIRRHFLDIALPIPAEASAHDNWLVELADRFGLVARMPEVLQYYRQHGRNVSDFSANTIDEIGPFERAHLRAQSLVRRMRSDGGLASELAMLRLQATRLEETAPKLVALVGAQRTEAVRKALAHRLAQLETRAWVRTLPLPARVRAIMLNWNRGGYSRWAAVMRDLTTSGHLS